MKLQEIAAKAVSLFSSGKKLPRGYYATVDDYQIMLRDAGVHDSPRGFVEIFVHYKHENERRLGCVLVQRVIRGFVNEERDTARGRMTVRIPRYEGEIMSEVIVKLSDGNTTTASGWERRERNGEVFYVKRVEGKPYALTQAQAVFAHIEGAATAKVPVMPPPPRPAVKLEPKIVTEGERRLSMLRGQSPEGVRVAAEWVKTRLQASRREEKRQPKKVQRPKTILGMKVKGGSVTGILPGELISSEAKRLSKKK